jgi:tripartite-type tricarboxylate transporter receptor subunit TctC
MTWLADREAVIRAPPDGYTLFVMDPAPGLNATLFEKLTFNFVRDMAPVASIARQPLVMVINPSVEAKTFIVAGQVGPGC